MHSGRQFGGAPLYSGKQAHKGLSPFTLQIEFGPHGDGSHGFTGIGSATIKLFTFINII